MQRRITQPNVKPDSASKNDIHVVGVGAGVFLLVFFGVMAGLVGYVPSNETVEWTLKLIGAFALFFLGVATYVLWILPALEKKRNAKSKPNPDKRYELLKTKLAILQEREKVRLQTERDNQVLTDERNAFQAQLEMIAPLYEEMCGIFRGERAGDEVPVETMQRVMKERQTLENELASTKAKISEVADAGRSDRMLLANMTADLAEAQGALSDISEKFRRNGYLGEPTMAIEQVFAELAVSRNKVTQEEAKKLIAEEMAYVRSLGANKTPSYRRLGELFRQLGYVVTTQELMEVLPGVAKRIRPSNPVASAGRPSTAITRNKSLRRRSARVVV